MRVFYLYNPLFFIGWFLLVVGMMVAVSTDSCLTAWLGMELNLVGLMGVFAVRECLVPAVKIKYFVVQCIASSMFLVGILSLKGGEVGDDMGGLALCSGAVVQVSLFLKIGVFPLHTWVPSVINSSGWLETWLLLTVQKLAPFVLVGMWGGSRFLLAVAAGSALVGGVGGLNQSAIRGILAYSSFVHTGWMLVGVVESLSLFAFYFLVYAVQLAVLVGSCVALHRTSLMRGGGSLLGGLSMVSLSGMPPFAGFAPKLFLLLSVDSKGGLVMPLLGSVISMKYYTSACCAMVVECASFWDWRLWGWTWLFVVFTVFVYGCLFASFY
uniref:NADH-ubiquinone oxidoreductase chain 2 n=1 Tax=Lithophaga curta TaxID=2590090 RepID=A0A516EZH3_9BIVA|nr:NADH dehydrogenase subunit 2 [Lithophaga curta]